MLRRDGMGGFLSVSLVYLLSSSDIYDKEYIKMSMLHCFFLFYFLFLYICTVVVSVSVIQAFQTSTTTVRDITHISPGSSSHPFPIPRRIECFETRK